MYADTDFFLALLKEEDWLKEKAKQIYIQYKNDIWTSTITLQELLLISKRENLDNELLFDAIVNLCEIKSIELDAIKIITAIELMKKYNATLFDSLHAIACENDAIISSDAIFDKIGLKRIRLEK